MVLYLVLVMALVFDLSISSGISLKALPYKVEICLAFALLILLLGLLRIKRRWQGSNDMKRFKSFHFVRQVNKSRLNLSFLYTLAECIFMGGFIFVMVLLMDDNPNYVLPMIAVVSVLLIESAFFAFRISQGGDSYRLGIDKKAVAWFDREMNILYFTGLKKIEMHQDMINFQYKEDLNLFLPLDVIEKKDRKPFKEALMATIEEYKASKKGKIIYIDDAFRNLE